MESDDLLVTLGLSSYESDLQRNWINAKNGIVWMLQKWTVSANSIRVAEFRKNIKQHGSRRGDIWSI